MTKSKMQSEKDPYVGSWRPHIPIGPISAHNKGPGPKYLLPSMTGHYKHDATKNRAPMYSMGIRHKDLNKNCSPGPKYALPSNMSTTGVNDGPSFSLRSRPNDMKSQKVPGPAHYNLKGDAILYPTPPSFTLYGRNEPDCRDLTPGPGTYNLPAYLGPNVVSKASAPAFTLRSRDVQGSIYANKNETPGPAKYGAADTNICEKKAPVFSISGRVYPPEGGTKTPAPNAYCPEHVTITDKVAPSFTFGLRHSEYIAPFTESMAGSAEWDLE